MSDPGWWMVGRAASGVASRATMVTGWSQCGQLRTAAGWSGSADRAGPPIMLGPRPGRTPAKTAPPPARLSPAAKMVAQDAAEAVP